jgi:hypothetical protein
MTAQAAPEDVNFSFAPSDGGGGGGGAASTEDVNEAAKLADRASQWAGATKKDQGWSWGKAAGAGVGGAATGFSIGGPYGAVVGAAAGLIMYGLGIEDPPNPGPALVPVVEGRTIWHHDKSKGALINLWPVALRSRLDPSIVSWPSSDYYQALVLECEGWARLQHPKIIPNLFGDQPRPDPGHPERVLRIQGWAEPSDCRIASWIPSNQAPWATLVEQWLDATGLPQNLRPDYDAVVVAEIETPDGEFMLPNGNPPAAGHPDLRGGIWPHAGYPPVILRAGQLVLKPDHLSPVPPTQGTGAMGAPRSGPPLYPIVLWGWRPTSANRETGFTRPPAAEPTLEKLRLVALQVPENRPIQAVQWAAGGGGGAGGKNAGGGGAGWLLVPAAGLALGLLGKVLR